MDKIQPFFSIITVSYNNLDGLVSTQWSIFHQTCSNFEWIVMDGGSSDGTVPFLKNCGRADLYWESENDGGIYDAMNKGISRSNGEYLVFLNSGDVFPDSDTLLTVHRTLVSAVKPDILFGGTEYVFADGKCLFRPPKIVSESIWHGLPANHQATYYSRAILEGVSYNTRYKICGDYYLIAKLYNRRFKPAYLEIPLVRFGVGGASYTNRAALFWEPYLIQRDVLEQPFFWRAISFFKRGISTLGMIVLKNIHQYKRSVQHGS